MNNNSKNAKNIKICVLIVCIIIFSFADTSLIRTGTVYASDNTDDLTESSFHYEHDPLFNPSAMADIKVDPSAVYGFSPRAGGSLKQYVDFDWTDPELVNGKNARQERIAYHESLKEMYIILDDMTAEGKSTEEIAGAVSAKRNEIRMAAYKDDPEGLEVMKARNLEKYGHEEGPLPDELYEQYGSWETVIEKAFSVNAGMDACLGLYDDYYDLYVAVGMISDYPASTFPNVIWHGLRILHCLPTACIMKNSPVRVNTPRISIT